MKKTLKATIFIVLTLLTLVFILCSCQDGTTVEINNDGYWVINGTVTDVKAEAKDGTTPSISINDQGYWVINGVVTAAKAVSTDGTTPTIEINSDGYWVINGIVTDKKAMDVQSTKPDVFLSTSVAPNSPTVTLEYEFYSMNSAKYSDFKVEFYYGSRLLAERSLQTQASTLSEKLCYGLVNAKITAAVSETERVVLKNWDIPISAPEYNIVSMNGSMPVLYFTLHSLSKDGKTRANYEASGLPVMSDAPTIISLERVNSYDWDVIPENTYWLPALDAPNGDFHGNNVIMTEYIRELYEINPDSKFNFYCVDNYPELILKFFVAQGITNYNVHMISDGTSTVTCFKRMTYPEAANGANADEVYNKMAAEWVRIKNEAANGSKDYLNNVFMGNQHVQVLENYAFVIATLEENVTWWCARKALLTDNANSEYITDLLNGTNNSGKNTNMEATSVIFPSLGTMLAKLSTVDTYTLKNLYKFNDQVFSAAGDKEILMVLGTSAGSEGDLESYLKFLKAKYGETHQIYYKGHPGWPTDLYPEKREMFDELGIIDVESYIAAEIILFYCPDAYLAGYQSSTFYSAQDDRIVTLFMTEQYHDEKVIADEISYSGDNYVSVISASDPNYSEYAGCILVEYADSTKVEVYNPTTGAITVVTPAE